MEPKNNASNGNTSEPKKTESKIDWKGIGKTVLWGTVKAIGAVTTVAAGVMIANMLDGKSNRGA